MSRNRLVIVGELSFCVARSRQPPRLRLESDRKGAQEPSCRKFIAAIPLPRRRRRMCMDESAAAIGTGVAQREWQDGLTRLFPVRVLPALSISPPCLSRA